jgi:hypothetical protein
MKKPNAFAFLGICSLLVMASQATAPAQNAQSFQNMYIALHAVRAIHHIPAGLEIPAADEGNKTPITFDPSGINLTSVFDSLVAQRPVYAWSFEDGVYDVYPRQQADALSQLSVANFVLTNNTREEAREAIFNLPEVRDWLSRHRAVRGALLLAESRLITPGVPPPAPKRVSLTLANVPLRIVLNQVIKEFGRPEWIISHRPRTGEYTEEVSIQF